MAKTAVVAGSSRGIGLAVAKALAARGERVIVTSRDAGRAEAAARETGGEPVVVDLARPEEIAAKFAHLGAVDHLVVTAVDRDRNTVKAYDLAAALKLVTTKLLGYTELAHTFLDRFTPEASVVLYGGMARRRPYPGSTTVSSVNGGISSLVQTLAAEMAPVRVNAIHPGFVSDSPYYAGNAAIAEASKARTPGGRMLMTADLVAAALFCLDNPGMNGANLDVDCGIGLV